MCCFRCYRCWSCDVHIFTFLEFFRFRLLHLHYKICIYTCSNPPIVKYAHIIHIHVFTLSISNRLHTSFKRPKGISRSTLNCELIWFDRTQHFSVFCCIAVAAATFAAATAAADVAAAAVAAFCSFSRVWIVKTRRRLYYKMARNEHWAERRKKMRDYCVCMCARAYERWAHLSGFPFQSKQTTV